MSPITNTTPSLEGRLLFAVPKKGRLQGPTLDLLSGADIAFHRSPRLDIALVKNHPIALVFLPAADIPTFVGEGRVDLGITGWDQVVEYEARSASSSPPGAIDGVDGEISGSEENGQGIVGKRGNMEVVMDLGFGKCRLQVQVPEQGPIKEPQELVGKNVVTSFVGLTERYFARLEAEEEERERAGSKEGIGRAGGESEGVDGISDSKANEKEEGRRKLQTKVKYVGGSVEAACALGVADGIVDLVESGETMQAAGLHALSTVVTSTAVLIASSHASQPALVSRIASRIKGVITAQRYVLCQYNIPRNLVEEATKITPGKRAPTITALEDSEWVAVSSMVVKKDVAGVMDRLEGVGATDILVLGIENSRTS